MSERVTLRVTMELLSDTIFGSGFSIPGGEDIAVCRDDAGYPYLKGTTFKGLLRESLHNWLAWTDGEAAEADTLLGAEGWSGTADGRRVQLTELTLEQPPAPPEDCFSTRIFTSMENGVAKAGTLRMATCICAGARFVGEVTCSEEDAPLLTDALHAIKWAGTMRSRGFGRVWIAAEPAEKQTPCGSAIHSASCIRYRLRTDSPLLITNLSCSRDNSYETRGFIPGSAIRGLVASELASRVPAWFEDHKTELLTEKTRFLDAVPTVGSLPAIPSIMGFYENKEETVFQTVVKDGTFTPGLKRAKLGNFCALDGDTVRYWSTDTDGVTRIQRNADATKDTEVFKTRYISAGQEFEGYILLVCPELAEEIANILDGTVRLGADRYEGFGKCTVTALEAVDKPRWVDAYGYGGETPDETLYLLALSPLTMVNDLGDPCGIDEDALAELLGVGQAKITYCSTSLSEYGGYNRAWKSRVPAARMYDRGSIFQIRCDRAPAADRLHDLERTGLGIRTAEGFGQVLFLRRELFEDLRRKETWQAAVSAGETPGAQLRRAKYTWIMGNVNRVTGSKLSRNQVGTIQAICEKAIASGGDLLELETFLEKNRTARGVKHGDRFSEMDGLIRRVLDRPLSETLGVPCSEDSVSERLRLLCMLFDHSRKCAGKGAQ